MRDIEVRRQFRRLALKETQHPAKSRDRYGEVSPGDPRTDRLPALAEGMLVHHRPESPAVFFSESRLYSGFRPG